MENFVRNTKLNIEEEIKRIEQQPIETLDKIKKIIDVIQVSLALLKTAVIGYQFQNPEVACHMMECASTPPTGV